MRSPSLQQALLTHMCFPARPGEEGKLQEQTIDEAELTAVRVKSLSKDSLLGPLGVLVEAGDQDQ